jgi:hypothetical protein
MTGWLASPFGRKRLLMLSVTGFTTASFFCGLAPSLPFLILFRIIQGAFGGGLQPLSQAILLESFPAEKRGIAMVETMQVRKSQLHINILGEHVNPANPLARQTVDGMRGLFMSQGKDAATATRQAYGAVWGMVQQQGAMLAYNGVFRFLALTFMAMLPLLFLMRNPKKGGAVMAH